MKYNPKIILTIAAALLIGGLFVVGIQQKLFLHQKINVQPIPTSNSFVEKELPQVAEEKRIKNAEGGYSFVLPEGFRAVVLGSSTEIYQGEKPVQVDSQDLPAKGGVHIAGYSVYTEILALPNHDHVGLKNYYSIKGMSLLGFNPFDNPYNLKITFSRTPTGYEAMRIHNVPGESSYYILAIGGANTVIQMSVEDTGLGSENPVFETVFNSIQFTQ